MRDRHHPRRAPGAPVTASGRRTTRRLPINAVVAATLLALTGCAGPDDPGGGPPLPGVEVTPVDVDPDAPLLQVHRSGGFVPFGWDFRTVPELTVYGDGRAVTHGPQIAIYPPPALPSLLEHELSAADVDALVAAAREARLLETPPDYGHPPVADVPTTFVTLHVDGRAYEHAAEALGLAESETWTTGAEPPDVDADPPGDEVLFGASDETRQARSRLVSFLARAHELVDGAGSEAMYAIERFAVMAQPAAVTVAGDDADGAPRPEGDASGTSPSFDGEVEPPVVPWPLDVALADASTCLVVDGADAQTLLATLSATVVTAQFEQAGVRYEAWFRPLLPHEETCADLA